MKGGRHPTAIYITWPIIPALYLTANLGIRMCGL